MGFYAHFLEFAKRPAKQYIYMLWYWSIYTQLEVVFGRGIARHSRIGH